jgi:hypothetical protein
LLLERFDLVGQLLVLLQQLRVHRLEFLEPFLDGQRA